MHKFSFLLSTTALVAFGVAAPALAQQAAPANNSALEEVVVTATRQTSTANRVAMTVSAVTQRTLDQQGVKSAVDLTATVPALVLSYPAGTPSTGAGVGTFGIRGIVATVGAATTGVYLDDTSLTKRANAGGSQINGAPIPILFDLDRVEILKGPQGTLYGGSSEGGTVRFITPTPSLTTYSGTVRAEVNGVEHGGMGDEFAAAVGGPIIQDKLGFRVSGMLRNTAGWIDKINPYTGQTAYDDYNRRREWAFRGALKWQVSENLTAGLSAYHSDYWNPGGNDSSTVIYGTNGQPAPNAVYHSAPLCFNNSTRAATNGAGPAAVACPAGALPAGWYQRPSYTYGPYNLGDYSTFSPYAQRSEVNTTRSDVEALTLDYQWHGLGLKSVTSVIHDRSTGLGDEGYDILRTQQVSENPGRTGFPLWAGDPNYAGIFDAQNQRKGWEQEFRVNSPTDGRLTYVAGVFLSSVQTNIDWRVRGDYNADYLAYDGLTASQRYGGQTFAQPGVMSELHAILTDKETAAFGEVTFHVTNKLKLTGGLRISATEFDFHQANFGFYNVGRNFITTPGAVIDGTVKSTPVTPKASVEYDFTPDKLVYFTAAKGYRPGGLNAPLNPACAPGLAIYGLTVNDIPTTYNQDSVWSYEVGGKFRVLDNRVQLNASAFQIDWTNIQVTQTVTGCPGWNQNGGTASSKGLDLQIDVRPMSGLLISLSTGYDKATYTQAVKGPSGNGTTSLPAYNAGDPLGVPELQGTVGVRYDFTLRGIPTFVRVDDNFAGSFLQGSSFGALNYAPFSRQVGATNVVNFRGGMTFGKWEVDGYVNNLMASRQQIGNAGNGQSSCTAAGGVACTAYGSFNPYLQVIYQKPRTIGLQGTYRF